MRKRAGHLAIAAVLLPLAAQGQNWQITPGVTLTETWSDNLRLEPDPVARDGWLTSVSPSLRVEHRGALLRLSADYRNQRDYYSSSAGDNSRNYLTSLARYDLVERRLWVEGRASITQERRSAFGEAAIPDSPGANANRSETRLYSISPTLRGPIGDLAEYQARLNASTMHSEGFANVETGEVFATIRNANPSARFGWSVDGSAMRTRSDAFDSLYDRRVRTALIYAPIPQARLSIIQGLEQTDFVTDGGDRHYTPGIGLEWSPSPRTQFAAVGQRRFFGNGYVASFRHRTPKTAWEFRSRRESTVLTSILGSGVSLESLMSDLLASSIPDPAARAAAVRRRMDEFGAAPTALGAGFVTARPFLIHSVDGTVAIIGMRNTLTLGFQHSTETSLLDFPGLADSFAESEVIRQRGYTGAWTHRLTPLASISFASAHLSTVGVDTGLRSSQSLNTLFLTTQLGPRISATLGVRQVDFGSSRSASREERAIYGSLSFRL